MNGLTDYITEQNWTDTITIWYVLWTMRTSG
jgi:hypothetical protein